MWSTHITSYEVRGTHIRTMYEVLPWSDMVLLCEQRRFTPKQNLAQPSMRRHKSRYLWHFRHENRLHGHNFARVRACVGVCVGVRALNELHASLCTSTRRRLHTACLFVLFIHVHTGLYTACYCVHDSQNRICCEKGNIAAIDTES